MSQQNRPGRNITAVVLTVMLIMWPIVAPLGPLTLSGTAAAGNHTEDGSVANSGPADVDPFAGGSGTEDDPYQIATVEQLQEVDNFRDANFILISDIDATPTKDWNGGNGFDPIGSDAVSGPFTGSFDGNGHEIRNLNIDRPDEVGVGLFDFSKEAEIRNLSIKNADVTGGTGVGILTGYATEAHIERVKTEGTATGEKYVGGFAGSISRTSITNSGSKAVVTGQESAGGFIGRVRGGADVSTSYAVGSTDGDSDIAGFIGSHEKGEGQELVIDHSYTASSLSDGTAPFIGSSALSGTPVDIRDSYWDTETTGLSSSEYLSSSRGLETAEMTRNAAVDNMSDLSFDDNWDSSNEYPVLTWEESVVRRLVVDDDGESADYQAIQPAIDDATPNDIVEVRPGTYIEEISIGKNITVIAPEGATVESPTPTAGTSTGIFRIEDEDSPVTPTIRGFVIDGSRTRYFSFVVGGVNTAGDWTVSDLVVKNTAASNGAKIIDARGSTGDWRASNITVEGPETFRQGKGVDALFSEGDWVVENFSVSGAEEGIDAQQSTGNWRVSNASVSAEVGVNSFRARGDWTVSESQITGSGVAAIDAADTTGHWTVRSTEIEAGQRGVSAFNTSGNWSIVESTIQDGSVAGVDAGETDSEWVIQDTTISGSDTGVIADRSEDDWRISDTQIRGFESAGVSAGETTQEGNWTLTNVSIEGQGGTGINARASSGDWLVNKTTDVKGTDQAISARDTGGNWNVHRTNFIDNDKGIDASGATNRGNARRNWWGDPWRVGSEQCQGSVDCGNPLGEPASEDATGIKLTIRNATDVSTQEAEPESGVDVYLFIDPSTVVGDAESEAPTIRDRVRDVDKSSRIDEREFLDLNTTSTTTTSSGIVRFTGLTDPDVVEQAENPCVVVVPESESPASIVGTCIPVNQEEINRRTLFLTDEVRDDRPEEGAPRIPRDDTTVRVGETVAIGYLEGHSGETYEWEVINGDNDQLLHTGTDDIDDEIDHDARVTSFRPEAPGEYGIAVRIDESETYTRTITAVESDSFLDGRSRQEIARRYAPVLNFHPDERFYPTRYEAYIENSELRAGGGAIVDNVTLVDIGQDYEPDGTGYSTAAEDTRIYPNTSVSDDTDYQKIVVQREYPETVYASVHEDVQFKGETYTAIGYWAVYIRDPKPSDASIGVKIAAAHTGDQEPVFVLLDDEGNPEWIAAQQHNGGELRAWERVQKVNNHHPILFIGDGSHPSFFGPGTDSPSPSGQSVDRPFPLEYLYQQQYFCKPGGAPPSVDNPRRDLEPVGCQADDAGEPKLTVAALASDYRDPTVSEHPGRGQTWAPTGSSPIESGADRLYEVTLLTGDEAWTEYRGDLYTYPTPRVPHGGSVPTQLPRWETDDPDDGNLTKYLDSTEQPGEQREVHPDKDQIDGEIADIGETDYRFGGTPMTKSIELSNTGLQPHDYVVTVRTAQRTPSRPNPDRSDVDRTNRYSYFVGAPDTENNLRDPGKGPRLLPNGRSVEVPLPVEGDGEWRVFVELSVYSEDIGDDELEQRYQLDSTVFTVSDSESEEGEILIPRVPESDAGGADRPKPVKIVFSTQKGGGRYDIRDDINWRERLKVQVGDKTVPPDAIQISDAGLAGFPNNQNYFITFVPPTQDESGEYDLTISYDGVSTKRTNAISYSEGETTQVAASLQIDRSGSMRGIMREAREGGTAFVEQATDEDYVSVVSYSSGSRIEQDLVVLEDGRSDVVTAIDELRPGGSTNIGSAMRDGLSTLEDAPDGTAKTAIIMTDGRRNRGPSESEIINDIIPEYNDRGICVYTIGFTSGADEQFLRKVAEAADCGEYRFAGEEREVEDIRNTLQSVFTDIAGDASGSDTIESDQGTVDPGEDRTGRFRIDDSTIRLVANLRLSDANPSNPRTTRTVTALGNSAGTFEVQLPATDQAQTDENGTERRNLALVRPDGTPVTADDSDVSVSTVGDAVIYRVDDPDTGNWTYRIRNDGSETAEYSVVVTGDTQTALDATTAGETYYVGDDVDLTASLVGPEGGVEGATVRATVTAPDGTTTTVNLDEQSPGLYTGTVEADINGSYTATVDTERGALSRQDTTEWQVSEAVPVSIAQVESSESLPGESDEFNVTVRRTDGSDENERVLVEASSLTAREGNATIPDVSVEDSQLNISSEETVVQVRVSVPKSTPPGKYEGRLRFLSEQGTVFTESVNLTVLEPAALDVSITDTNTPVTEGDPVKATVELENTGEVPVNQTVVVSVTGIGVKRENIRLNGSSTTQEEVVIPTTAGDAANVTREEGFIPTGAGDTNDTTIAATTLDDSDTVGVEILGPAFFDVIINEEASETNVTRGEQVVVTAFVGNIGDEPGNQTVVMTVDGERQEARVVKLDPGELQSVEFTFQASPVLDGGRISVTTNNATAVTQLSVEEPSGPPAGVGGGNSDGEGVVPPTFELNLTVSEESITPGEEVTFTANIANVGEENGSFSAEWYVDGQVVDRTNVSITSSAEQTVTLTYMFQAPGSYTITFGDEEITVLVESKPVAPPLATLINQQETLFDDDAPAQPAHHLKFEDPLLVEVIVPSEVAEQAPPTEMVEVAEGRELASDVPEPEGNMLGAVNVTVPDAIEDAPATLVFVVSADRIEDSDAVVIQHYDMTNDTWRPLPTNPVDSSSDNVVRVNATTSGFSLFAVTEMTSDDEPRQDQQSDADESEEATQEEQQRPNTAEQSQEGTTAVTETATSEPETGGFEIVVAGVLIALLTVLTAGAFLLRRRQ